MVKKRLYPITAAETMIGRKSDADIVLGNPEYIAALRGVIVSNDGVFVQDLGSTHGTFVNGQRVERTTSDER